MDLCASLLLCLLGQDPAAPPSRPPTARLEFRTSPAVELYHEVRFLAATRAEPPVESLRPALEAAAELERELGPMSLAWGPFEGLLAGCEHGADLVAAAERAPGTVALPDGKSVEFRARLVRLAHALEASESACADLLARNAESVALARAAWDELVGPKEAELLRHHQERLGFAGLAPTIPVYFTAHGARPGAVTYFDAEGRGVCFVAVEGRGESELFEVVLHEATHALDIAAGERSDSLLSELRDALGAAGFDERSRPFHDLPHLLMFLQSAESVRAVLASEHEDYGVTQGVYARLGPRSAELRESFAAYSGGRLARSGLVAAFVARAK